MLERFAKLPWELRYLRGGRFASRCRQLMIQLTHRHCRVEFNGPVRLGKGFDLWIPDHGTLIVGPGVDFRRGFVCEIEGDGRVEIGQHCFFTNNVLIQCATSITIGDRCAFGQSVLVVDGFHKYKGIDSHWLDQGYEYVPLTIGDGVGVSDKCTVQASIGERTMVASGSRVTKPLPAFCVAAGSPARAIDYFGPADQRPGYVKKASPETA